MYYNTLPAESLTIDVPDGSKKAEGSIDWNWPGKMIVRKITAFYMARW